MVAGWRWRVAGRPLFIGEAAKAGSQICAKGASLLERRPVTADIGLAIMPAGKKGNHMDTFEQIEEIAVFVMGAAILAAVAYGMIGFANFVAALASI